MKRLKIHIIKYLDVFDSCNIFPNHSHITEYLNGGRQDILENFDIFTENVRSKDKKIKNFDIFEIVKTIDEETIIVIGFYLELLEFWGQRHKVKDVLRYYSIKYPNNKIIVTWNHDIDAAHVFGFIDEFPNLRVLNFNTSIDHSQFIILPFWTIDDDPIFCEKKYLANLVCSFNNPIRKTLRNSLQQHSEIFVSEKVSYSDYRNILSSSKFTFCPKGLGLSSYRFFESFHSNSIPILIADNVILPYNKELNYDEFIIRIPEKKCNDSQFILETLNNVDYDKMLTTLNHIRTKFTLGGIQEEIKNKLNDTCNSNS